MLDILRQELQDAMKEAVIACFGPGDYPSLPMTLPPQVEQGDFTFGIFPLAKPLRKGPPLLAKELAARYCHPAVARVEAVGPYLNLFMHPGALAQVLLKSVFASEMRFGFHASGKGQRVMVEFSSPNTNKPLHIGHMRNNLLGWSTSQLLHAMGYEVIKACLVNDRGIHICKSMLGYHTFFAGQTPTSRNQKGDHFVGDIYVAYEKALKAEKDAIASSLKDSGLSGDALDAEVSRRSPLMQETQEWLRRWEAGDAPIRQLWQQMNGWVYEGFEETYRSMGVAFDRYYYESELYLKGRALVLDALEKGIVERRADGAVVIELSQDGLDPKVLLRSDGTSLYITQDIGVALEKWEQYQPARSVYVIGNEQDHQMKVLFITLKRMGYAWAEGMYHLSYGMVNLPDGRMKSREGRVIDADDLLREMQQVARAELERRMAESGEALSEEALAQRSRMVALGGIKFFFLKINPRKDFIFNPQESIQFQGDTGPYIQYTHARIKSIVRKAAEQQLSPTQALGPNGTDGLGNLEERALVRVMLDFPRVVAESAERYMPSTLCTYLLDLAGAFNKFYHEHSVLKAESQQLIVARLGLAAATAQVLATGLELLGIPAPEEM